VDLALRDGMSLEQTLEQAKSFQQSRDTMGFDQAALDQAAAQGYANGWSEDAPETVETVLDEFYPEASAQQATTESTNPQRSEPQSDMAQLNQSLQDQLQQSFAAQSPINGRKPSTH